MAKLGVDYSWSRPGGAAIKAAGFEFVMRYCPYIGDEGKGLTASELADLQDNGLAVGLVYESTAGRPLSGRDAGIVDAIVARAAMEQLGFPASRPMYFAVDFDANQTHFAQIDGYLGGAASILGAERVGVYGGIEVIDHCAHAGTAHWFWQTYAWSGGRISQFTHVFQYRNGQTLNGGSVDYNEALKPDFGQWEVDDFMAFLTEEQQKKLLMRLFAGSERAGLSDDEKLALAIADLERGGAVQSVSDVAYSALVIAMDANPTVPTDKDDELQAKVADALAKAAETIRN